VTFSKSDIDQLHHLYRINLINSCSGFKSANLIGTKSENGIENVAVFSSITHIGSNPPLLGFFCRPTTVIRNTYENIKKTGIYTINHIHEAIIEDAHHTSAKYDKNDTILVIGEIQNLYLQDNLLEKDGFINLSKAKVVSINGLDGYTVPKLKTRLAYQRPKS